MKAGIIMSDQQCRFAPLALMRLQNWLPPAFPIGSCSYSHGLEWAARRLTASSTCADATCRLYERTYGLEEDQMKVARILRFGPPNVITNDDLPRPEPAAGQLLVRVKAAGVGNWDSLIREGKIELQALPIILGCGRSAAPGSICKFSVQPGRIASAE